MIIHNVIRIRNRQITTSNGTIIELPDGDHTIKVLDMPDPLDNYEITVMIEFYTH